MDNHIGISCLNNFPNIILYNLNNLDEEKIIFKAHLQKISWIIKSNGNNLITSGNDGYIKIWPFINDTFISGIISNENKDRKGQIFNKSNKLINANLNPIFEYKSDNEELKKIYKMINIKGNQFLAISEKTIFLFKYIINEKKISIELIKNFSQNFLSEIVGFFVINKNKNEIIAMNTRNKLYFLNIPNFDIINNIKVVSMSNNSLVQLNSKDLLISDDNYLKIFDLNKFTFKYIYKNHIRNDFLLNFNDGTILQSCDIGVKRYLIKTMKELPIFVKFSIDEDNDEENYENYIEKILYMYMLKDKRILACYQNGKIQICKVNNFS